MPDVMFTAVEDGPRRAFYAALAKAQGAIEGAVKGKENPAFRSRYADLGAVWEACREHLSANGIGVLQKPRTHYGDRLTVSVQTILTHASGHAEVFEPLEMPVSKPDAQGIGSAITYARRYSLMAAVGVAPEDDDGNAAVQQPGRTAGVKPNGRPTASASKDASKPTSWPRFIQKLESFTDPDECDAWFHAAGTQELINAWPKTDAGDWAALATEEFDKHVQALYAGRQAAE